MKPSTYAFITLALATASADRVLGQTLQATQAVHEVKCRSYLGIFDKCVTIETDRIHSTFTRNKLDGRYLFGRTWATASHCTRLDTTEEKCKRSVLISTDPAWNRVIWGQSDNFLRAYGIGGTSAEGPGHFLGPLGVDITRREGEWHVGFVADAGNDRIVVIAVGYTCKCVRWLGTLDGSESGTPLRNPHDVAWDPFDTWRLDDDRVFIADTDNNRIVVYQVSLDPVAGTMTKAYVTSFGTEGQGPSQFFRPQGITVRSRKTGILILADIHVADAGNERVSLWYSQTEVSSSPGWLSAAAQSSRIAGSDLVGITRDHYGDVLLADRARDVVVKLTNGLAHLKTYGGTPSWSTGNFNDPTDAAVIYHYWQDAWGFLVEEGLPYVQTVEQWTATTGGQLHHLGVDAEQLGASAGVCDATFTFLFTAYGDYTVKVKNSGGAVVQSWTRTGVSSGLKSEYWNGKDRPPGTYSYVVEHRNAYGDETEWRTSVGPSFSQNCFTVTADAPSQALQGGTYALNGLSTHPADSWKWERSDGSGYYLWANAQNSSFHVPFDPGRSYTILWRLTARRSADGMWDSDGASTTVLDDCNRDPCPFSPSPTIATSDRTTQSGVGQRVVQPQTGPERHNGHVGSGAWIGGRTGRGPRVFQLYGFTGAHAVSTPAWPNALAGDVETVQEAANQGARSPPRAVFSRKPLSADQNAYRVRFVFDGRTLSEAFVGLALDPELGARPSDDLLGIDAEAGLIWVADPDSGVIGYLVTDKPAGSRVAIRQFSTRKDAWRPDPVSDSAAYAEISAGDDALTAKPGDARFLIAVGPVAGDAKLSDVGFVMFTAPSLAVLRERAANAPRSVRQFFGDDTTRVAGTTAITRFHLTQAPPDPTAPEGVRAISPELVPRLSSSTESTPLTGSERGALRDAVRRYGITALAFAVPDGSQAHVKIRLYDPAGRLVRTLVDETYDTGAYRVQWDLKDQRGSRVAPGVYIAVMETKGFRAMTKLVVVP
jgi:hypothetical protein